jgi:hypothetical protein
MVMAFTRVWDLAYEDTPADNTLANQLGARIRDLKLDTRERGDIEHNWGAAGTGRHNFPSGAIATRDAITDVSEGMIFLRTDMKQIDRRGAASWDNEWRNYDIGNTASRPTASDLPDGYLYFDTDLEQLMRYHLANTTWFPANGKRFITTKFATDNDQAMTGAFAIVTGMSQAVTIPDDGMQYEIFVTAVVHWRRSTGGTKVTLELRRDTVQQRKHENEEDTPNVQHSTILIDHFTTPVNNTTYTYDVRGFKAGALNADDNFNPTDSFSHLEIRVVPRFT